MNKSKFRKIYIRRLIMRIILFFIMIGLYIWYPNSFEVAKGFNFIKSFSPLHIIWIIWMIDMVLKLCRVPKYWPLGSQKVFGDRFLPDLKEKLNIKRIKEDIKKINKDIIVVAILWILVCGILDALYLFGVFNYQILILISTFFYVCDIICIVGWCPFKTFFMHNKCCTTCRIFNWDHAMMYLPLIVIPGVWTYSLVLMAFLILLVWEIACANHPERFFEKTNCALRCHNCKDRLCGKSIDDII